MQQMQTQRYRKAHIPHALRRTVWNTYIGEDIGSTECYVGCKTKISQMTFECGHIEAESKGGLTIVENLRPICSSCNKSMGTKNMHDFMKTFGFKSDIVEENEIIDIDVNDNTDNICVVDKPKKEIVTCEPIKYFIENCIEYKKGTKISFDNMYDFFNGFCSEFYNKKQKKIIKKEQFIEYFINNNYNIDFNVDCNMLNDYKFKYEIDEEDEYEYEETFYDVL